MFILLEKSKKNSNLFIHMMGKNIVLDLKTDRDVKSSKAATDWSVVDSISIKYNQPLTDMLHHKAMSKGQLTVADKIKII